MSRTTAGLVAFGFVALLGCGLVAVVLLAQRQASTLTGVKVEPIKQTSSQADPWPECRIVRQWIQEHTPEPASVEVIRWVFRKHIPADSGMTGNASGQQERWERADSYIVQMRFRAKNNHGGRQVELREWSISGDKVNWSQRVEE